MGRQLHNSEGDLQLSLIDFTGLQGIWLCKDVTAPLISQLCFFIDSSAAMQTAQVSKAMQASPARLKFSVKCFTTELCGTKG